MKLALIIITSVTLLASILFYFTTDRSLEKPVDMPWHIKVVDSNHTEVFGIQLNKTTLAQARKKFDQLDGLALYQDTKGIYSLEAYFGKVSIGPFSARLIANLDVPQEELESMTAHTIKRVKVDNGSYKWTLESDKQVQQSDRVIKAISYIPAYSGMDQNFIRERFGEPESLKVIDETTQLWFYPKLGVRIMVDNDGKELFEYMAPAQFTPVDGEN